MYGKFLQNLLPQVTDPSFLLPPAVQRCSLAAPSSTQGWLSTAQGQSHTLDTARSCRTLLHTDT